MSFTNALIFSILACLAAAALEGLCAGRDVKSFFAQLRFPKYAAPLWLWSIIGGLYYLIFGVVLFRLLRLNPSPMRFAALVLIAFMMIANGLSNYVIFRAKDLFLSFIIGSLAPLFDAALFVCAVLLDRTAAVCLVPYLVYRVYGVWWGYALWQANREVDT